MFKQEFSPEEYWQFTPTGEQGTLGNFHWSAYNIPECNCECKENTKISHS